MYISSLRRSDHAYYQATVVNPVSNVTEITDTWLSVQGKLIVAHTRPCKISKMERVTKSCQILDVSLGFAAKNIVISPNRPKLCGNCVFPQKLPHQEIR